MLMGSVAGQAAVALRTAIVDGLHQEPVNLLTELRDVWGQGPLLQTPRRRKDVLIQWRAGQKESRGKYMYVHSTVKKYNMCVY